MKNFIEWFVAILVCSLIAFIPLSIIFNFFDKSENIFISQCVKDGYKKTQCTIKYECIDGNSRACKIANN